MNLSMTGELAASYKSGAQRARVVTEAWGEKNLFCPNCSSPKLIQLCCATPRQAWLEPGHPASDYSCTHFRSHLTPATLCFGAASRRDMADSEISSKAGVQRGVRKLYRLRRAFSTPHLQFQ
jgi:Dam-replacing family